MATELEINLIRRIAVGDILRRRAADSGNHEALVEYIEGKRHATTYGNLNKRVNQLTRALRAKGLEQGDRIAILGANTSEFVTALMACFKGGFVAVPVNFVQSPHDVEYNIEHSGARAIFADAQLHELVREIADNIDRDFVLATLTGAASEGFADFETFLAGQSSDEIEDVIIDDDDLAQIMYTSGTTARPKGVMLSHKNLYIATLNTVISIGVSKDQLATAAVLPVFHITAELFVLVALHFGSRVVLANGFDPAAMLEAIESERLQFLILLPLMWKALLGHPQLSQHDYSSMQLGMYGMAPMDAPTLEKLKNVFGCPFITGSGQTEINGVATIMEARWAAVKEGNIWGDGSATTDQAVMDDQGNLLPAGEIGEIVWRSPQTMLGYYRNEEATSEAQAHGWHHSGDIGFLDDDRQFHFVDRKKDIVKSGGENVSSVKVERTILAYPGVANVGVIGLPHSHWGEAVTAVVAREADTDLDEQAVIEHCKQELGGFEVPKKIIILDQLPMTATGKVKKHLLRQQYVEAFADT